MRVTVETDGAAMGARAADAIASAIRETPNLAVAVATGNTPMGTYARLAGMRASGDLDAARVRPFQLDEYLGRPPDDPQSLWSWMERSFVVPLGIPAARVRRFETGHGGARACAAMDGALHEAGGLDLAILGLGPNGHLGFNEPPCGPDAPTREVALTPESLASNAAYWTDGVVPARAVTLGMATILAARRVLLLVSGPAKHRILRRAVEDAPSEEVPASWLQKHTDCKVIADRAAWEGA